jgi:hypothetical protein
MAAPGLAPLEQPHPKKRRRGQNRTGSKQQDEYADFRMAERG